MERPTRNFLERGLLVGLNNKGAFDNIVTVDLSSRALFANRSLLEIIKVLIMSGLNFTMKKKDSIHINMIAENKIVEKDTSKKIGFDVYLLHKRNLNSSPHP